ncbi:hypothetical protein PAPYR_3019 [Paratrimastix pyriformis]|uniref:Uncharacterized protein n=1 Tax=Paratrimastix pyriformis TaxID=342808 RepID=A0ABQ8UTT8_9EUKA|nr:hypothetical protein PAPYR_3019 [Paratrimastix pyriformis]
MSEEASGESQVTQDPNMTVEEYLVKYCEERCEELKRRTEQEISDFTQAIEAAKAEIQARPPS